VALLDSEVARIKYELGYNVLAVGAEPYIGIVAVFDQVIQPYTTAGAATTSSTPVTAATSPTPQTLVLASATGFNVGDVVVVDVDSRQERATIQALSGASATAQLSLAHSGTYPVTVEGGETIVREILRELRLLSTGMNGTSGTISTIRSRLGLKKVDDVEFFGGGNTLASQGRDPLTSLLELREYWRDELAGLLGIPRLNDKRNSGGSEVSVY
jgi:bifunctional DNA-binding transcriptional regulator/antitoxin component of YhaV-PrlF toxin-antitoxin module